MARVVMVVMVGRVVMVVMVGRVVMGVMEVRPLRPPNQVRHLGQYISRLQTMMMEMGDVRPITLS